MKRVIFISALFTLISMCGCKQEASKESEITKEQETSKELNIYQIMDIQFKILDASSKDFLVEEADKLIPKEAYSERVAIETGGKAIKYSLNTGYKLSVNEVFDEKSGIVPYTSLEAKFDIYDMEDTKTFIDGILDYLKENIDEQTACVYIQHPNYYGNLEDAQAIGEIAHGAGAKYIMGVNPISLGIIKTPAEYGADVAVGDGQPLGLPLGFGGPYLGFMAATEGMMRKLPGRIVGQTEDHNGKTGYVLTLQAREQHIRREKASSNICSNQALCALAVGVYMSAMGSEGIKEAALQSASKAHYLAAELDKIGFKVENKGEFFHEFVTVSEKCPCEALKALEEHGILGGYPLGNHRVLWCCTEMNTKEEIDKAVSILKEV